MKYLVVILIGLSTHISYAQENPFFLSGGAGYNPSPLWASYAINATYITGSNLFTIGFQNGSSLTDEGRDNFTELSAMYGKTYHDRWFRWHAAVGLCNASGDWEDNNEDDHDYSIIGVPIETQIIITPVRFAGIGLKITKTFRDHSNGVLIMATLHLGKLMN